MNEQTRKAIDRARLVLKAAPNPMSEFYAVSSVYVQPGVLATLCDALEVAHTREANALKSCLCGRRGKCAWCRVEDHRLCAEAAERRAEEAEALLREQADAMTHGLRNELRMLGERNAAIVECDTFKRRTEDAEARVANLENVRIEQAAKLRRHLDEIAELRERAGLAEGREAAAKANAEEMAGWLDARNAGLVQMARERDALRIEAEALRIERDVADRECDRLRAQVDADRQELTRIAEKVARMVARVCAGCHGRGVAHLDGGSPRCAACGGAGAVIVETRSGG